MFYVGLFSLSSILGKQLKMDEITKLYWNINTHFTEVNR